MTPEDRLSQLLHSQADSYAPGEGLARIEEKAHARRRGRAVRRVAVPLLVAVVIAAIAVPLLSRGSTRHSQHVTGQPPSPTAAAAPGQTEATSPPPTTKQAPVARAGPAGGPVPPGFIAASVTFISNSEGWVLGTAPCGSPPCTSVLRTRDGGRSWRGIPAPRYPACSTCSI